MIYYSVFARVRRGIKAVATYDSLSQIVRLDVSDFLPGQGPMPGHFYFVYAPWMLQGYESHPFTICSWNGQDPDSLRSGLCSSGDEKGVECSVANNARTVSLYGNTKHSFIIRPYSGFTDRLRNEIAGKKELESLESGGSREITLFLEGPYGTKVDLSAYYDVPILAGGSGITAAISHTYHLLGAGTSTVHISWAVPQPHLVDNICNHELASAMRHPRFKMHVHITSEYDQSSVGSYRDKYGFSSGRPDVYEVMRNARVNCERDLAVVSCGTPAMADDCRAAVVRLLKEDGPHVEYHNESLMW